MKLSELISKYQYVDTSGKRPKTECPFHKDYYDSMRIFDEKGEYVCFDCGVRGDASDFIMRIKDLTKEEALSVIRENSPDQVIKRLEEINFILQGEMLTLANEIDKNRALIIFLKGS